MKYQIKSLSKWLLAATTFCAMSCSKSYFTDANVNVNAPSDASITPAVLLSTVEATLGYTIGGDISRYTSLITQQTFGAVRQAQGYYGYVFTSVDFDSPWGNMYTSVMQNNKTLMNLCDSKGYNYYGGISRILMAYSLQVTVDCWGSIPYSKSFGGASNLKPSYDNDKALYDTIASLLTVGIARLSNSANKGALVPGGEDIIYSGSATNWVKFAHAIKARLYIHQSKGNAAMANNALAEIAQSFTSNADNAKYGFGETETSAAPWYQFNEQRGDIEFDNSTLANQLLVTKDPRFNVFIDSAYNDVNGVGMGDYYGAGNATVEFISYDELMFMKAEATLTAAGSIANVQGFYQTAIISNMTKLGVATADINTFLTANGTLPTTTAAAIAKISAQEYVALYLNPEAFSLWRRTNSPVLTPVSGNNVPRRFLYPQTEYSYNKANVPASTLFTPKIFWDN